MTHCTRRRLALCVVLALSLCPALFGGRTSAQTGGFKTTDFKGKVVPLAGVLEKAGAKLDVDVAPYFVGLVSDDGKIYPLVKDDGARMFFTDKKVLDRPMRLTGRLVPGTGLLQVTNVYSYLKGQLHEVYYWCDICSIRGSYPHNCDCCGDPMVLREVPAN
ncbi:MAG: hypothetical protein L0Z62_05025 [Gemmataceae bacterium]|nr:hypothetical protein [Gemmataceae bacterium]